MAHHQTLIIIALFVLNCAQAIAYVRFKRLAMRCIRHEVDIQCSLLKVITELAGDVRHDTANRLVLGLTKTNGKSIQS
jgi:hypothetical protein